MASNALGDCQACRRPLGVRVFSFDRHIEQYRYRDNESIDGEVLEAETLSRYCSAECAWSGVLHWLGQRGIKYSGGSAGPIAICGKCGQPLDMTKPHVAYTLQEELLHHKPGYDEAEVLMAEGVADTCIQCGGAGCEEEQAETRTERPAACVP